MPTPFEYMQIATGVYAASDRNYEIKGARIKLFSC